MANSEGNPRQSSSIGVDIFFSEMRSYFCLDGKKGHEGTETSLKTVSLPLSHNLAEVLTDESKLN